MHKFFILVFCSIAATAQAYNGSPSVPSKIKFADIQLQLTSKARERIQEKVDSLTKSPQYFKSLLDRVNLFLPIVKRILKEENVPEDFQYQVIQESACIADAVHHSNSVGFWQFKEPSALEVGLQIDQQVDERMNITAATRGAATYLKMHKQYFNSWLYALLAYNRGRKGAEELGYQQYRHAKYIKIDATTHWYIIHFLAHKIAFEKVIGRTPHPLFYLYEYKTAHGKNLQEIAQTFGVAQELLQDYNKWLKCTQVPIHITGAVIVPMTHQQYARKANKLQESLAMPPVDYDKYRKRAKDFPILASAQSRVHKGGTPLLRVNKIPGFIARQGDSLESLATIGNIPLKQLIALNDIEQNHVVVPGQVYYYKAKNNKAALHFHIVQEGETWWSIAQKYGIKKKQLLYKNRLRVEEALQPGRVLWLRFIRPAKIPISYTSP